MFTKGYFQKSMAYFNNRPGQLFLLEYGCTNLQQKNSNHAMPPPQLPVIKIETAPATTYQLFPASIQGKVNVEIRPQVDGYLQKMYVDEGAYVKAGQLLFKINDAPYIEQLNNAKASFAICTGKFATGTG